ncbi:MAG: di-heme-cytochrome C peroxidase [Bryobacteraceae bacterium]
MRSYVLVVIFAVTAGLAGCSREKPATLVAPAEAVTYTPNGWSGPERAEYYHLAEGSELMPYSVLANVISVRTEKPFLEGMERFGFIPDAAGPQNPHGLPVGITVTRSRSAGASGIEMAGFNCAACHVGQITYRGKIVRVDGAPSLINLQAYQMEFKDSLDAALKDPRKALALVIAMDREQRHGDTPTDAVAVKYAEDPTLKTASDVGASPTADKTLHTVSSKAADSAAPGTGGKTFSERLKTDIAFLKARLAYMKNGKLLVDGTEPGPGRVDAFGAARNLIFTKFAVKMQSPVSFPFLWSLPDNTKAASTKSEIGWIHYDGNTNSILERNIGQALGMGAVFDPVTWESTLRIENLHRLELLTRKLQPPKWPADVLGTVDEKKAQAGAQIFHDKCEGCHQGRLFTQVEIGTDPNRANSFGQPVGAKPFPNAVAPILTALKKRAFQDDGVAEAEQIAMDADPVIWRATGKYLARPLQGVWATAPFLHNGSVPSLYHMLHPDQRPSRFGLGSHEYDPDKVGYRSDIPADGSVWVFDTSQPGNSNIGHSGERFGTTLPEDQKSALLEYLKTL